MLFFKRLHLLYALLIGTTNLPVLAAAPRVPAGAFPRNDWLLGPPPDTLRNQIIPPQPYAPHPAQAEWQRELAARRQRWQQRKPQ